MGSPSGSDPLTSPPGRADTRKRTSPKGMSVLELNAAHNLGDRHPWRAALAIGILTVAAGMVYSVWLAPWVRAYPGWWMPDDSWVNLAAARRVAAGGFASIYQATPLLVVTPLYPILLVPLAILGSYWHLAEGVAL